MKYLFIIFCLTFLFSCKLPTLDNVGGVLIEIESDTEISDEVAEILVDRLEYMSTHPDYVMYESQGNKIIVDGVGIDDTVSVKELVERNRMMKVVYAVEPSVKIEIQQYLKNFISKPTKTRPYKKSSLIGLVEKDNISTIDSLLSSEVFKSKFPSAGTYNYGVKLMEGKKALFIQDANSPYMDQNMFEEITPHNDPKKVGEGVLSLKLKDQYSDKIGQLTGNDSTYLLHLFHDEVYISKIIKPHITSPSFGMGGAFTPRDVLVHTILWLSQDIDQEIKVKSIKEIPKKK